MRKQIYVARGWRGVWREVEQVARTERTSASDVALRACSEWLERRRARLARARVREANGTAAPSCSICGANPQTSAALSVHQLARHSEGS